MNSLSQPAEFGIGMTDKSAPSSTHTNTAPIWFAAADILMAAGRLREHETWDHDPSVRRYIDRAFMEAAEKIADWLGYDLVPRVSAKEAHEFALSKGYAEDGPPPVTSAPGFDGRAKVVGPDDRDPIEQVLR